jgi:hypothetical protein
MNIIRFDIRSEEGRSQPKMGSRVYGSIATCAGIDSDDKYNSYNDFMHLGGLPFCKRNQQLYYGLLRDSELVTNLWGVIKDSTLAVNTIVLALMERTKKLGYS